MVDFLMCETRNNCYKESLFKISGTIMGGVNCEICGKKMRTRYNLKIHMAVHTGEKPYNCDICQKGFQQKWNLITHISRIHAGHKPFECKDCGRSFGYASHFKAHVKSHFIAKLDVPDDIKRQVLLPFPCPNCSNRFENDRLLTEHMRTHTGEKPFVCDSCGKAFMTRRRIMVHVQRCSCVQGSEAMAKRRDTDPTPCEICGKIIARYSMNKHLNIHTRRRLYSCRTCGREFLEAGQRSVHERTHTGYKPHQCEVCNKGHTQLGNLLSHRRRHHGLFEKPKTNMRHRKKAELKPRSSYREASSIREDIQHSHKATEAQGQEEGKKDETVCSGNETIKEFLKAYNSWILDKTKTVNISTTAETNEGSGIDTDENIADEPCNGDEEVDSEIDVPELKKDKKEEIFEKLMEEIGQISLVNKTCENLRKKGVKDILMRLLKKMGKDLPKNSIICCTEDGSYLWSCWDCRKSLRSRPLLLRHRLTHAPEHERPFRCSLCERTFTQAGNLQHHLLVHRKEHRFFCEVCGAGFRHQSHFKTHKKRHNGLTSSTATFQCDMCGKSCSTRFHLIEHIRTHTNERPYLCLTCGAQFAASSSYTRHLRRHDGKKQPCPVCGKEFSDRSSLQRHQISHEANTGHSCSCGKVFAYKASLWRHKPVCSNTTSPLIKAFECSDCKKTFMNAAGLKRHSKSHDPVRRYQCDICQLMLKTKETLARHLLRHRLN